MAERADAGLVRKRETQRERVAKAISLSFREEGYSPEDDPPSVWDEFLRAADAAIAAHPDPHIKKERDRPRLPTDDCVLCATRAEFTELVAFVSAHRAIFAENWPRVVGLADCLRAQGVVAS